MLLFFALLHLSLSEYVCNEPFSCSNLSLVVEDESISCYGLGSCKDCPIISNTYSLSISRATRCWGTRACQNTQQYIGTVQYAADVRGKLGLAWSKFVNSNNVRCFGEGSCFGIETIIYNDIYCHGLKSCKNIKNGTDIKDISARGGYSLMNSVFYNSINDITVSLYGFYSGFNATLYCSNERSCIVECKSNGCQNFNFYCNNNDQSLCQVYCNETNYIACPNQWPNGIYDSNYTNNYNYNYSYSYNHSSSNNYGSLYSSLNLIDAIFGGFTSYNTNYIKNYFNIIQNSTYVCDSSSNSTCSNNTWTAYDSNTSLSCVAWYTCLETSFTIDSSDVSDVSIDCAASLSCRSASFIGNLNSFDSNSVNRNNSIYCSGRYGCGYADIKRFDKVAATGYEGISNANVSINKYVGCFGTRACDTSIFIRNKYIFATAYQAILSSSIISSGVDQ